MYTSSWRHDMMAFGHVLYEQVYAYMYFGYIII